MRSKGERNDVLTLQQAGAVLEMTPEAIRLRIKRGKLQARFDRGSRKLGYIIERDEFIRYLREIGEDARAVEFERGDMPKRA